MKTLALSICGCTNSNPFVKHQMLLFMVPVLFCLGFFFLKPKRMLKTICFLGCICQRQNIICRINKDNVCFLKGAAHLRRGFLFVCLFVSLVCLVSISWLTFESNRCEPAPRKEHSNLSYLQKKHPLTDHTHFPARSLRGHRDKALVISSVSACGCD